MEDIRPGDIVQWRLSVSDELVGPNETMWSDIACNYVEIGSKCVHLVIDVRPEGMTWINPMGTFIGPRRGDMRRWKKGERWVTAWHVT